MVYQTIKGIFSRIWRYQGAIVHWLLLAGTHPQVCPSDERSSENSRIFSAGAFGQMIAIMPAMQVVIANVAESIESSPEGVEKLWEAMSLVMEAIFRRDYDAS